MKYMIGLSIFLFFSSILMINATNNEPIIKSGINGTIPILALAFLGFVLPKLIKRDQNDAES